MVVPPEFQSQQRNSAAAYIRKVRDFEGLFDNPSLAVPIGLAYLPALQRFLAFQARTSATTTTVNAIIPTEEQDVARSVRLSTGLSNPLNTVFDSKFNRLLVVQNSNQLIEVKTDASGAIVPSTLKRINLQKSLGLSKPEGISIDPATGTLYILNNTQNGAEIVQVTPNSLGGLENASVSRIAIAGGLKDLRGIALDPTNGRFQLLSPSAQLLHEVTTKGEIVATRDVKGMGLNNPQALVFAPSGDQTDSTSQMSLFVADSTTSGSGIVELSLSAPQTLQSTQRSVSTFSANSTSIVSLVQIVQTGTFAQPSPDPSGITYIPQANGLMISDGEIDEIPTLFAGKNLFQTTLNGSLQQSFTSTAFSLEPTGIAYNPANGYLYISDDNADRIFQLNPGADGLYNTADDFSSILFSTRTFNSFDPEDVAFSPSTGNLFIVDGVNAEVYQVTMSGTLVSQFDTAALGVLDPEGITFLDNGNLAIVGNPANQIAEITTTGSLVRFIDISAANPIKPAGLAFGPTSNNPTQRSIYVVDRGIDNSVSATQNDGRMYEFSLGTTAINQAPIVDAGPDQTIALRAYLRGRFYDDGLTPGGVTNNWSVVSGPGSVTFANTNNLITSATFSAPGSYVLRLNASDGQLTGADQVSVRVLDPQSSLFVSTTGSGTIGNITFQDEDILVLDQTTNTWSVYFDGTDVGLSSFDVKDFHINSDGTLLFSLNTPGLLPGLGTVEVHDIVRFVPTATGENTEGRFEMYFDGSDVGLTTVDERLDGIAIAPDGRIIISVTGLASVPGLAGSAADEDLLAFSPTSLGENTAGSWSLYFDGSDVGLTDGGEDIDGVWIDSSSRLLLTTDGAFNVPGAAGNSSSLFRFTPTSLGTNTAGSYSPFWTAPTELATGTINVDGVTRLL